MKNLLLVITIALFSSNVFASMSNPYLRARIPYGENETLVKAIDLPDEEMYQLEDSQYFDIGYKYTYFHILFIPLWIEDEGQSVVGISADGESYLDLTAEDIAFITESGIEVPTEVKTSFWHSMGGKLLIGGVILAFLFFKFRGSNDKEEES